MEKIIYYEKRKELLDWYATCGFDSDEELEDYWKELESVNLMLIQLKGGKGI